MAVGSFSSIRMIVDSSSAGSRIPLPLPIRSRFRKHDSTIVAIKQYRSGIYSWGQCFTPPTREPSDMKSLLSSQTISPVCVCGSTLEDRFGAEVCLSIEKPGENHEPFSSFGFNITGHAFSDGKNKFVVQVHEQCRTLAWPITAAAT